MAIPFFLDVGSGDRFCIYHAPLDEGAIRGAYVYIHPFAEEMNKSRRMAALQARSFAMAGYAVLQIDLFGCGDSSGDFVEANWDIWKDDLRAAVAWLERKTGSVAGLWGLRLGALLALDLANEAHRPFQDLLLWQPVVNGEAFLTQFLRMRLASEMLGTGAEKTSGTQVMRERLSKGEAMEIAGYELAPALAARIDSLNAAHLTIASTPIHWFEVVAEHGRPMPPASARIASGWEERGVQIHRHLIAGSSFWASQEITECPELLKATTGLCDEVYS
ncbi:hydrolase 2, exosortase A system-associated [Noviherbaspirillum sp. ST9]|uniref:hydrolase 2, exosortase A system-associated n=1 Tax=Noviherbaspirillum sp. ST9 TaxID=3401606 RepID=UPI003B587513